MAEDVMLVAERLARQAAKAQSRSEDLWRQRAEVTEAIAVSEERIAATLARLADEQPSRAARLRAMSKQASSYAAEIRQRDQAFRRRPGGARLPRILQPGGVGLRRILQPRSEVG